MRYPRAAAQVGGGFSWRYEWLAHLANLHHWQRGAELGLRNGTTFHYVLQHCPQLTLIGVDCWADGLGHQRVQEAEKRTRDGAASYGERAVIIKDYTVPAADWVQDGSLDFVFVDADHSEAAVRADLRAWRPKVRPGGWVIGHDINWPSVKAAADDLLSGYVIGPDNCYALPL